MRIGADVAPLRGQRATQISTAPSTQNLSGPPLGTLRSRIESGQIKVIRAHAWARVLVRPKIWRHDGTKAV